MATEQKSELQKQREAIDLELAQLQLEDLKFSVTRRRAEREQRLRHRAATEESLAQTRIDRANAEANCLHRKGGKNTEGFSNGNSPNYSVIKHTLPQGGVMIVCQRCPKEWHPPVRSNFATGAEGAAEYKAALLDYRAALNFPTDNEPSGTQIFAVHRAA